MTSSAGTFWAVARPSRRRILSSPLRIVSVMVVLFAVLALETTNAMANGTVTPSLAPASLASSSAPPIQKPHAYITHAVLTATAPSRATARPRVAATATHPVAKRVSHHRPTAFAAHPRAATASSSLGGYGCGAALSYLAAHSAPGFHFDCPGNSEGHQAMTCINVPGICPGSRLIVISVPCAAAYMNEASNSWVLSGLRSAPIDPYGYCR